MCHLVMGSQKDTLHPCYQYTMPCKIHRRLIPRLLSRSIVSSQLELCLRCLTGRADIIFRDHSTAGASHCMLSMMALVNSEHLDLPPRSPVMTLPSAMVSSTAFCGQQKAVQDHGSTTAALILRSQTVYRSVMIKLLDEQYWCKAERTHAKGHCAPGCGQRARRGPGGAAS